jgi:hypothetical protein
VGRRRHVPPHRRDRKRDRHRPPDGDSQETRRRCRLQPSRDLDRLPPERRVRALPLLSRPRTPNPELPFPQATRHEPLAAFRTSNPAPRTHFPQATCHKLQAAFRTPNSFLSETANGIIVVRSTSGTIGGDDEVLLVPDRDREREG